MRRVEYTESAVPEALQQHIRCAWTLRGETEPGHIDTIYPDGCCEIIVHRGTPPNILTADGSWQPQGRYLFAAQHRSAIRLASEPPLDCFGIRLQPQASTALCTVPLLTFRDRVPKLQEINAEFAAQLRGILEPDLNAPFGQALWQLLDRFLGAQPLHPNVSRVVEDIEYTNGNCRIDSLAKKAGASIRQLQNLFTEQVGLTPKEFSRVIRLQATLRQLDQGTEGLAELAAHSGFADQAHASRELRRMTGLTPARLRQALQTAPDADSTVQMAAAFVRGGS